MFVDKQLGRSQSPLSNRQLQQHLQSFCLGDLIDTRYLEYNVLSTLYELNTTRGRFLVRILQNHSTYALLFEEAFLDHLALRDLRVPRLIDSGDSGSTISITSRQQLSVFHPMLGRRLGIFEVQPEHCSQAGEFLASIHLAGRGFRRRRRCLFEPHRIATILEKCVSQVTSSAQVRALKIMALELIRHHFPKSLPRGIIHGGLFVSQAYFVRGNLSGVQGFESASCGPLVFDIALALSDWAFLLDQFVPDRAHAFLAGYQSKRPLLPIERGQLYELTRYATTHLGATCFRDFEAVSHHKSHGLYRDYQHFLTRLLVLRSLGPQTFRDVVFGHR